MSVLMAAVPPHERPRERLLALGPDALADRELIALVLRNGAPDVSAVDLAGELLADYGSLERLARARPEELAAVRGIGPAKAAGLVAAFHLARRAEDGRSDLVQLQSAEDVAMVAQRELRAARRERVIVLVADAANRLIRVVAVSEGAIDRSIVPVREILNAVLRHDGRAFAIAHNHPSADVTPSEADRRATADVAAAARTAGLRFLGHVVVAASDWCRIT